MKFRAPQQNNGYDCGIYALLYIKKIVQKIRKGISPNKYESNELNSKDAEKLRRNLFKQITGELKDEENKGNKSKTQGKSNPESDKNTKTQICRKGIDENDKNKKILEDKNMKTKTHSKSIDGNDRNKKKLEECWHYTNRQCEHSDDCDKIHKDTCTYLKKKNRNM